MHIIKVQSIQCIQIHLFLYNIFRFGKKLRKCIPCVYRHTPSKIIPFGIVVLCICIYVCKLWWSTTKAPIVKSKIYPKLFQKKCLRTITIIQIEINYEITWILCFVSKWLGMACMFILFSFFILRKTLYNTPDSHI